MSTRWLCFLILVGLAATSLAGPPPVRAGEIKEFRISTQGYMRLEVPAGWKAEFQRPITEQAPTILFSPAEGNAFKLLLTVQWGTNAEPDFNSPSQIKALLEKEWQEIAPSVKETRFEAHGLQGSVARGLYFLATDKEPKPGDYGYMLRAGAGFGRLLLSATLVYQKKDSPVVQDTINLLRSASLSAN